MNIGFVLDDTLDTPDGVQQYVLLLGSWLTKRGHAVSYLTANTRRKDIQSLHALAKQIRVPFNRNVVPLVLPTSPKKISTLLYNKKFDVIHVQLPTGPAFGSRIVALAPPGIAIIGTFHVAPFSKYEKFLTKALGYWIKPSLKKFDSVVSVSKPAQQLAEKAFGLQSKVIPNTVDIARYKKAKSISVHKPVKLLFLGRLVERKGCRHFLYMLSKLSVGYRATIAGDGPQRDFLEKLCVSLGIENRVQFLGFVNEKQKEMLLADTDLAVFPSIGGESFGIVLIEAMATGTCVVIAGDNDGYKSVLGTIPDALINPKNHIDFAKKIDSIVSVKSLLSVLYKKQQGLISQYDINTVGPKIEAIYAEAIAKH